MSIFDDYELGRSDDTLQIESREDNQAVVTEMAQQSRHSIEIISRSLDPALYDFVYFVVQFGLLKLRAWAQIFPK